MSDVETKDGKRTVTGYRTVDGSSCFELHSGTYSGLNENVLDRNRSRRFSLYVQQRHHVSRVILFWILDCANRGPKCWDRNAEL